MTFLPSPPPVLQGGGQNLFRGGHCLICPPVCSPLGKVHVELRSVNQGVGEGKGEWVLQSS